MVDGKKLVLNLEVMFPWLSTFFPMITARCDIIYLFEAALFVDLADDLEVRKVRIWCGLRNVHHFLKTLLLGVSVTDSP